MFTMLGTVTTRVNPFSRAVGAPNHLIARRATVVAAALLPWPPPLWGVPGRDDLLPRHAVARIKPGMGSAYHYMAVVSPHGWGMAL